MTIHGEQYPSPRMLPGLHDLLAVYIRINILTRRLVGEEMGGGRDKTRRALLLKLIDAKAHLERSAMWN